MPIGPPRPETTGRSPNIAELAAALAGSKERFLETTAQGRAFMEITRAVWPAPHSTVWSRAKMVRSPIRWWQAPPAPGMASRRRRRCTAFLHGAASNLVSAGVRLVPLGQTDGQRMLAVLEAPIAQTAGTRARRRA